MLVRRVARPLLSSWFVSTGLDALRHPSHHVASARPAADAVTRAAGLRRPLTDRELTWAVRAHGGATVLAAASLAVGRAPRTSGLALAALTAPLVAVHQPLAGRQLDPERVAPFVQSLGALGAALLAGADTAGSPSFGWRVRQARGKVAAQASDVADKVASSASSAGTQVRERVASARA